MIRAPITQMLVHVSIFLHQVVQLRQLQFLAVQQLQLCREHLWLRRTLPV